MAQKQANHGATISAIIGRTASNAGTRLKPDIDAPFDEQFEAFRQLHKPLGRYLLADARTDVMAARVALGERLARMAG